MIRRRETTPPFVGQKQIIVKTAERSCFSFVSVGGYNTVYIFIIMTRVLKCVFDCDSLIVLK